jgi:hypothetical protein
MFRAGLDLVVILELIAHLTLLVARKYLRPRSDDAPTWLIDVLTGSAWRAGRSITVAVVRGAHECEPPFNTLRGIRITA